MHITGEWKDKRRSNLIDGGAPFYDTYRCSDGKWISVGSIEPQFYALLLEKTGAPEKLAELQMDKASWPESQKMLQEIFETRTRAQWCELLENTDTCFAPVLSMAEAPEHPHNAARKTFVEVDGVLQPAPAPRFSATPSKIQWPPAPIGQGARETLADWGVSEQVIAEMAG
jgi:alpha-methylacyl-CoA racemase